jgi:hypothetical protein
MANLCDRGIDDFDRLAQGGWRAYWQARFSKHGQSTYE